jgi:small-conductance mechanosensitive channel
VLVDKLIQKLPCKSDFIRMLIGSVLTAVIVSVAVVTISRLLGFPAPAAVAGALGAAAAYAIAHRRTRSGPGSGK